MSETQLATLPQNGVTIFTDDSAFERALRLAETMSKAQTMPKHLKTAGDCLRVVELALRTNQSPYALADKTFVVGGKVAFEGQLCAALLNASPVLETRLNYEYEGEGNSLKCVVSAKIKGEPEPRSIVVNWKDGHDQSPSNQALWKKQPEQQLAYWGARVWGRRHAPEVLMGIYTPDEIKSGDYIEVEATAAPVETLEPPKEEEPKPEAKRDFVQEMGAKLAEAKLAPDIVLAKINELYKSDYETMYAIPHENTDKGKSASLQVILDGWDRFAKRLEGAK